MVNYTLLIPTVKQSIFIAVKVLNSVTRLMAGGFMRILILNDRAHQNARALALLKSCCDGIAPPHEISWENLHELQGVALSTLSILNSSCA